MTGEGFLLNGMLKNPRNGNFFTASSFNILAPHLGRNPHGPYGCKTCCKIPFTSTRIHFGIFFANKNNEEVQHFQGSDLIKELNLHAYEPFKLPLHASSFSLNQQRHWYCFTAKVEGYRRRYRTGFWKKKKAVTRDIIGGADNVVLGKKSQFMFFLGNSVKNYFRTNWIMYEYALVDKALVWHFGKLTFPLIIISLIIN